MTSMVVLVGNAPHGWDALVERADVWAGAIAATGVAQTGGSSFRPRYLAAEKFINTDRLERLIDDADIVITHGGIGSIGDCLRHAKRFVVVPRLPDPRQSVGDQVPVAQRLGEKHDFPVVGLTSLEACASELLTQPPRSPSLPETNVPELIRSFLQQRQETRIDGN
jgi:UDP-N-acetylglucosamine transferase subunit ALG13